MVIVIYKKIAQVTRFECVVNMKSFKKKFISQDGNIFTVNEVVQSPAGLTVYYTRESDGIQFSCLIDAFSERFKELAE
jgi:rRNA maturation protein Rpf1